jgi:hypothetical protein
MSFRPHRSFVVLAAVALTALALAGTATAQTPVDPSKPPAATPDLTFTAASTTGFTLRNAPCGFTITPCRGGTASSILVSVRWDAGAFGQRTSLVFLGSLVDGASITIDYAAIGLVPYPPGMPCGSLTVTADPGNAIVERKEWNNARTVTVGSWLGCV